LKKQIKKIDSKKIALIRSMEYKESDVLDILIDVQHHKIRVGKKKIR